MGFKVLGWDASGPQLTVGYIEDGHMLALRSASQPRLAGSHLVAWIHDMVAMFGRPDGIAVGVGPGSFTGVRVAVTAAKAYSVSWGVPVRGVSSLASWARSACPGQRVVVTSEKRGQAFYLGYYWVGDSGVEPIIPDMAIQGILPNVFPTMEEIFVVGPLAREETGLQALGPRARALAADLSGVLVALEGWSALQWGKKDDPLTIAPAYLRAPAVRVSNNEVNYGGSQPT